MEPHVSGDERSQARVVHIITAPDSLDYCSRIALCVLTFRVVDFE
jgi:hypothetical protein